MAIRAELLIGAAFCLKGRRSIPFTRGTCRMGISLHRVSGRHWKVWPDAAR